MGSEAVEILIDAEDRASAKLKQVGDSVEKTVKGIGGKAKASTELVGTLANQLGNTQFGAFAGELAGLTERISAFSEVSQAGGAGALAFKAGLVAATAITSFKIGEAIGSWAFETERWKEEMQAAAREAQRLAGFQQEFGDKKSAEKREDISLIRDPKERAKAIQEAADALKNEATGMDNIIELSRKNLAEAERRRDAWSLDGTLRRGEHQAEVQMHTEQLERNKAKQAELRKEESLYREMLGRQAEVEARRAKNAADDKSDNFIAGLREQLAVLRATKEETFAMEAAKNTSNPRAKAEAEGLLRVLDIEKQKEEARKKAEVDQEQARRKQQADQEAEANRIERLRVAEAERLELKRIELEQGKEAARARELELKGLGAGEAAFLAKKGTLLDALGGVGGETPGVQAKQGRLLTRGDASQGNQNKQIAENTKAMLKAQLDALEGQNRIIAALEKEPKLRVAMIN